MSDMQDSVVVNSNDQTIQASIIWMHGLGADANDFKNIVPQLGLASCSFGIQFVFPNAPMIPITINNGMVMRGWYDIRTITSIDRDINHEGILTSVHRINQLIESQLEKGIPANKIILAGFSQGGVIALYAALLCKYSLAGVLGLSTYLPDWNYFKLYKQAHNDYTSFQLVHGLSDAVVPYIAAEHALDTLKNQANLQNVHLTSYPMQHEVCMEEVKMIGVWIKKRL